MAEEKRILESIIDEEDTSLSSQRSQLGEKEKVTWVGLLNRGDAISFRRKIGPFKYKHHGIVEKIIPGTTRFRIIHVTGTSKDVVSYISSNVNTGICSDVIDFKKETDIFKYTFPNIRQDLHSPAAVAEMFLYYGLPKELGFPILHFNFEIFSRNCATWIVYSKQTRNYNEDAKIKLDAMVRENGGNYILRCLIRNAYISECK
ncbi:unnamed protein product [Mytilus coruscus]|uniref:Uncharacterized protein n=1 Tax=Mytilus coruscus TaxID=42192 RepID=A0A6J8BKC4_MYTCO|nr:unnamed protein product [Mytilus coruscus]